MPENVDVNSTGIYSVTYTVADALGNTKTVIEFVAVYDPMVLGDTSLQISPTGGGRDGIASLLASRMVMYDLCNDPGQIRVIISTILDGSLIVQTYAADYKTVATGVTTSKDISKYVSGIPTNTQKTATRTFGIFDMQIPQDTQRFIINVFDEHDGKFTVQAVTTPMLGIL